MPTYAYKCGACGHEFDLFQAMTAGPKRKCPECGALKLRRLLGSGGAIIFRGSGFYETDYRRAHTKGKEQSSGEGTEG